MADGSKYMSSRNSHQNISIIWNTNEIRNYTGSSNLSYDNKRIKWTGTFDTLQNFVKCVLKLDGKWWSPGGYSKKFTCYDLDLSITWYPSGLNTLIFHGEASSSLVDTLINVCKVTTTREITEEIPAKADGLSSTVTMSTKHSSIAIKNQAADELIQKSNHSIKANEQTESHSKVSIEHDFNLGCQCRMLAADLEGVKLDIAIMCKDIEAKLAVQNLRDSDSKQVRELKHELLNEKEKRRQLEADISILVQGRYREVNELKNTITSLENKFKLSDAANESLRHSLMQINLEKINGASSVEQSPLNHSKQINTYNTKAPAEALNKENTDQFVKTAKAANKINTRSKTDRHQGPLNNPAESCKMAPEVIVSVSPVSRSLEWIGKLPLIETSKSTSRPPKTSEKPGAKTPGTSEWIGKLPLIEAPKLISQPPFLKHRQ